MSRQEIARKRRRISIESMLEVEVDREAILRERLEELIGEADGWKIDDAVMPGLPAADVALLEAMQLVEIQPDEENRERYENDIRDFRDDIEECLRRQHALRSFLAAIDG